MEVEGFKPPQEEVVPVRRSARTHRAPERLCQDVEVEEHSLGDLNEPANYNAIILDPESDKWLDVMNAEMQSMKDNQVWCLVDLLPPNAHLVSKGYTQTYEVDYEETFSPVADIRAIRIFIAIAAFYDYEIWQMDVKSAFLNGYLNEEIYMVQPKCFVDPNHSRKVGSIIYAVSYTRPDVTGNPEVELRVDCYCDAGFETDRDDIKSQTGYVFVLNGGAVNWKAPSKVLLMCSPNSHENHKMNIRLPQLTRLSLYRSTSLSESFSPYQNMSEAMDQLVNMEVEAEIIKCLMAAKYVRKRSLDSRSARNNNATDGIDIGMSNVPANDDDVAKTTYSAKASSKRRHVHSHRCNVVSSSTSSRPLYVGDNSSSPINNSNGQPDRPSSK
nr:hypothetical protein [Tanacetum cinerariifolium]